MIIVSLYFKFSSSSFNFSIYICVQTSVLINPRETPFQEVFDEFSVDQSAPITVPTVSSSTTSSHASSHHSNNSSTGKSSSISRVSSTWATNSILGITKTEEEQLKSSVNKLQRSYKEYYRIRASQLFSQSNISKAKSQTMSQALVNLSHTISDDIFSCYREVPEVFFRQDFDLTHPDTFNQVMGTVSYRYQSRPPQDDNDMGPAAARRSSVKLQSIGTIHDPSANTKIDFQKRMMALIPAQQQDKLTKFLDLIELGLLKHIWMRSSAFFHVLNDVRALETLILTVYRYISEMRRKLLSVTEHHSLTIMRIPKLHTRQKNETVLCEKLTSMQRVLTGRSTIQAMVEMEDYLGALEVIAEIKQLYHDELESITCMKKIGSQLDDYDTFICEVMCNKFVSIAIQWDDTTFSSEDHKMGERGEESGDNKSLDMPSLDADGNFHESKSSNQESFEQLVLALMQVDRLKPALNMYKNRLSESVRLIVRTCVLEYLSSFDPTLVVDAIDLQLDQENSSSTPFAQRVRGMSSENFLSCISMCFEHVLIALTRAESVRKFTELILTKHSHIVPEKVQDLYLDTSRYQSNENVSNLASKKDPIADTGSQDVTGTGNIVSSIDIGTGTSGPTILAATEAMVALSKSCMSTACDLAQRSIAQLLSLRKESTSKMTVDKMKFLWEVSVHFINSLESLMGASVYVMRQGLINQTKVFLDQLHESYKGKLVNTLDNERWIQCDVSPERQADIDRLVSGKSILQSHAATRSPGISKEVSGSNGVASSSSTLSVIDAKKKEARPVIIDGSSSGYNVVWSVLLLAEVVMTYLDVAASFPSITTEIISKTVELVRLFDTRARQLVLGAQAIQSAARLKSISAKHLSITAQSVGLISALLPHVRAALLSQVPPKHHLLLTEFDRISHELIDHHNLIVAKFVSIVGDFVDASAGKLRMVDWDRFQGQSEYFEEVLKNVSALHRVLSSILPPEQVQDVFSRIFSLLSRKIPSHFEEIMPSTQTGRQRILDEVSHLVMSFSRLKQVDCKTANATLEEAFRKRFAGSQER